MDKATALCDWKRMLRAWRAWRAVVWEEKKRQEVARTEKELQKENRQEAKRNGIYKDPVYTSVCQKCPLSQMCCAEMIYVPTEQ